MIDETGAAKAIADECDAIKVQKNPEPNSGDVWLHVIEDMNQRRAFGIAKYKTPVQAFNGRDALLDAYQEVLDLAVYLRQAIDERDIKDAGETHAN